MLLYFSSAYDLVVDYGMRIKLHLANGLFTNTDTWCLVFIEWGINRARPRNKF